MSNLNNVFRGHCLGGMLILLTLAPGRAAFSQRIIDGIHTCNNRYAHDDEQTLGDKVAAQVFAQQPVLRDSDPVSVYVSQLGRKLVDSSPNPSWNFQFHVVDSGEINAFALPGGAIFVNLATVVAAESEAQLAGVIAHESLTWSYGTPPAISPGSRNAACFMALANWQQVWCWAVQPAASRPVVLATRQA